MQYTKDYRMKYDQKAKELVSKMTLEQKVFLMGGKVSLEACMEDLMRDGAHYNWYPYGAGGIPELGVPEMLFCDGPRGVVCGNDSTCFPVSMARGATFDPDLEERIGNAIGEEVRAHGGNLFAGVCINLPYHPGWGRSQETYGEESYHIGEMGRALTRGVQDENVVACVKHFAFNSMEISRFKVSVTADKRTEQEVYLPHFKKCIDEGAGSVMTAYNLYQGEHCGHSEYLMTDVLRKNWAWDGFIMSDFMWGLKDTVKGATNGMDMEMCHTLYYGDKLVQAVKDGEVPEEKVTDAAIRIVRTMLAYTETPDKKEYTKDMIGSKEHIALALEAAQKSITLIKNENVLPLCRDSVKKIALIGKLGNVKNIGDHGSSQVFPPYVVTPLEGIQKAAPDCEIILNDGADLESARKAARNADAVVFVVGYNHDDEGEYVAEDESQGYTGSIGGDRESLSLHTDEIALLNEIGPENKNSVAVLIGGNTILMSEWQDAVSSVLMAYYPGMEGGTALAQILFGDVNPSGKLPYVVPVKETDLPQVDWDTTEQFYEYYHGYAKLEKENVAPLYPYGHGLSYTSFAFSDAAFSADAEKITASVTVTNTGARDGCEVAQFYVGFKNSKIDRPVKLLRGFQRVDLKAGEHKRITIECAPSELNYYNTEKEAFELEHMEYEAYIGSSADEKDLLQGKFSL